MSEIDSLINKTLNLIEKNIEIWVDIKEYEELYQVSNYGNIKRKKRNIPHINNSIRVFNEKLLKLCIEKKGYSIIRLSKDNKIKSFKVHRLVALHFSENVDNLEFVNHVDGNKLNNFINNLEWVSNRENINHYLKSINKTSKYPGVSLKKDINKWHSRIRIGKIRYNLGTFINEIDAYNAYIYAQKQYNIIDKYGKY